MYIGIAVISLLAFQLQHRVSNPKSPAPEPGAETQTIPSLVEGVKSAKEWKQKRRPEIEAVWRKILGGPSTQEWFGDIRKARVLETQEKEHYTRILLELPIEKDFYQPHLLLLPKGQGRGPFPAVVCWASSTPDYTVPEQWWGEWLASHGYVVLTGWSFIRNYRDGTSFRNGVSEKLYERFGHWLPMGKMVHDAQREAEFLKSRKEVDAKRLGFMGMSLSAKAAVYVAAFAPEFRATVAIDPHIAVNGSTNWFAPWYLDWTRPFNGVTTLDLLNPDKSRPGFEHDHHELMALAAPRAFLLIGGSRKQDNAGDSDDLQSWGYVNRAKEVYTLLGVPEKLQFVSTEDGHHANGPAIDPAWRNFLDRWLKQVH